MRISHRKRSKPYNVDRLLLVQTAGGNHPGEERNSLEENNFITKVCAVTEETARLGAIRELAAMRLVREIVNVEKRKARISGEITH